MWVLARLCERDCVRVSEWLRLAEQNLMGLYLQEPAPLPSAEDCGEKGDELMEFLRKCFDCNGESLPHLRHLAFLR